MHIEEGENVEKRQIRVIVFIGRVDFATWVSSPLGKSDFFSPSGSIADKNRQIFIQTSHFCFSSFRKLVFVSIISSFYKFKLVSFRFVCKDSFVIV